MNNYKQRVQGLCEKNVASCPYNHVGSGQNFIFPTPKMSDF